MNDPWVFTVVFKYCYKNLIKICYIYYFLNGKGKIKEKAQIKLVKNTVIY